MRESFIFYKSFYKAINKVKDKELKADIYDAICELGLNEHVQELDNEVGQIIMELIKPQIMANKDRYEKGHQGGRPKEYDEQRIEDLILQGYSNKEIEEEIGCSISTIKNIRTKTRQKLGQKLPKRQKPNVNEGMVLAFSRLVILRVRLANSSQESRQPSTALPMPIQMAPRPMFQTCRPA